MCRLADRAGVRGVSRLLLAVLLTATASPPETLIHHDQYHWLAQPRAGRTALAWLEQANGYAPAEDQGLWVADSAGRSPVKLADEADRAPVWSPDGRRLAWLDDDHQLHSARADGSDARLLAVAVESFAWSPDGERLAVETRGGELRVGERTLLRVGALDGCAWSPDGRTLAAWREGRAWLVRLADGRPRRLAQRAVVDVGFAPDGRLTVVCGARRLTVWLGGRRRLVRTGSDGRLVWSPRGDRFALSCVRDGRAVVGVFARDGRALGDWQAGTSPRWSPDGGRLAWVDGEALRVDGRLVLRQAGLAADWDWLGVDAVVVAHDHQLDRYALR